MALTFIDGFDHYVVAERLRKWTANQSNAITSAFPTGRFGSGKCLNVGVQTNGQGMYKTLGGWYVTVIVGHAVQFSSTGSLNWLYLRDNGTNQVELWRGSDGRIGLTRNGTWIEGGNTVLAENTWYYVELKVTINNTTGSYECRVNGQLEFDGTNADTQNTANAYVTQLGFQSNSTHGFLVDDVYVLDTSGGAPYNDFLGDCRIEALMPSGNGNSSQFDGSDGNQTDNYLLVDDPGDADDDTTYVESPDVNDKDTYAYGDLVSTSGAVWAVCPIPLHRKTASGSRTVVSVARTGGGTEEDSAGKLVMDSYLYHPDYRTTKPGGGSWSIADVNAAEFGMKVTV